MFSEPAPGGDSDEYGGYDDLNIDLKSEGIEKGSEKKGGYAVSFAWIYNGQAWSRTKPMNVARHRPACGLYAKDDGFRILVTGML